MMWRLIICFTAYVLIVGTAFYVINERQQQLTPQIDANGNRVVTRGR